MVLSHGPQQYGSILEGNIRAHTSTGEQACWCTLSAINNEEKEPP